MKEKIFNIHTACDASPKIPGIGFLMQWWLLLFLLP